MCVCFIEELTDILAQTQTSNFFQSKENTFFRTLSFIATTETEMNKNEYLSYLTTSSTIGGTTAFETL